MSTLKDWIEEWLRNYDRACINLEELTVDAAYELAGLAVEASHILRNLVEAGS